MPGRVSPSTQSIATSSAGPSSALRAASICSGPVMGATKITLVSSLSRFGAREDEFQLRAGFVEIRQLPGGRRRADRGFRRTRLECVVFAAPFGVSLLTGDCRTPKPAGEHNEPAG